MPPQRSPRIKNAAVTAHAMAALWAVRSDQISSNSSVSMTISRTLTGEECRVACRRGSILNAWTCIQLKIVKWRKRKNAAARLCIRESGQLFRRHEILRSSPIAFLWAASKIFAKLRYKCEPPRAWRGVAQPSHIAMPTSKYFKSADQRQSVCDIRNSTGNISMSHCS